LKNHNVQSVILRFSLILFASLPLLALSQQFSTPQRTNEVNPDVLPAWYQTPQKPLTTGYGFGRNPPAMYERAPATNYQNYPSFGSNRPAYPELMAQQARRYPMGGQDIGAMEFFKGFFEAVYQRTEWLT
ncbi:hypothetical protein COOONC_23441, partial [Cooperia oncophora]